MLKTGGGECTVAQLRLDVSVELLLLVPPNLPLAPPNLPPLPPTYPPPSEKDQRDRQPCFPTSPHPTHPAPHQPAGTCPRRPQHRQSLTTGQRARLSDSSVSAWRRSRKTTTATRRKRKSQSQCFRVACTPCCGTASRTGGRTRRLPRRGARETTEEGGRSSADLCSRWIGRQLLEVICSEFRDRSVDYYVRTIRPRCCYCC